jgi:hypothetical protein
MALSVLSAYGQVPRMLRNAPAALEQLGASPAVRELVAGAARKSGLAKSVLEAFGYKVESGAAAASQLQSLSAVDLGTGMMRLSKLDQHLPKPTDVTPTDPLITCGVLCQRALRDYGTYTLGAAGTVPLSVYADVLVREQSGR